MSTVTVSSDSGQHSFFCSHTKDVFVCKLHSISHCVCVHTTWSIWTSKEYLSRAHFIEEHSIEFFAIVLVGWFTFEGCIVVSPLCAYFKCAI